MNNTTTGSLNYGNTGLPVIAANDNLTILGNGDTIERSTATGTPDFRLLRVASGGSLTLENLTLQGGMIEGSAASGLSSFQPEGAASGGAIFNQGTLVLNGVTVQDNVAGFGGPPVITFRRSPPPVAASFPVAARSRWRAAPSFRTTRPSAPIPTTGGIRGFRLRRRAVCQRRYG